MNRQVAIKRPRVPPHHRPDVGAKQRPYLELLGLIQASGMYSDLTTHTLSFLTGRETCNAMCTCTRFRDVAKATLRAERHCALIRNHDIEEELTACPRVRSLCYEGTKTHNAMFYTSHFEPLISRVVYTPAARYIRHIDICVWEAKFSQLQEARDQLVSLCTLRLQVGAREYSTHQFNFIREWSLQRRLESVSLQVALFDRDALHTAQIKALCDIPALGELELVATSGMNADVLPQLALRVPRSVGKFLLDVKKVEDCSGEFKRAFSAAFHKLRQRNNSRVTHLCLAERNCMRILVGYPRCTLESFPQ